MEPNEQAIGNAYVRLQEQIIELGVALDEAVALMKQARGHYGIEECAGPGQPDTEWDEIQDDMQKFVWRWDSRSQRKTT